MQATGRYLGGMLDLRERTPIRINIDRKNGIMMFAGFKRFPLEARSGEVHDPQEIEKRTTLTRLAAFGPFALAAKKSKHIAFVTVETADGDVMLELKAKPQDVRGALLSASIECSH